MEVFATLSKIAALHKKPIDPEADDEKNEPRDKAGDAYLLLQELTRQPEQIEFHEFGHHHHKTRGYLDGCFDLCHAGHYNAVRQARLLTDTLVFGLNSD